MSDAPFRRRVVRAAKPSWSYAPVSGDGAARHGGRFNPKGVPALYTSFRFETCAREVRFSLNTDPYTFYYLDVRSTRIIDLSAMAVREDLGVTWADLECPNWESQMHQGAEPATHKLATRLIARGVHGIIVPSFAPGARPDDLNLVLWTWRDAGEANVSADDAALVTVLSPDLLPRDRKSWGFS